MTQVKGAQGRRSQLAWQSPRDARTLAQQRADFAAQMRDMALSDLKQVSERLKGLHDELDEQEGRKVTQYELADDMGIPHRTFQSWENGEVENRDGKGYDRIARYYSRKLGRKVTRNWIVFGDRRRERPSQSLNTLDSDTTERLTRIEAKLTRLLVAAGLEADDADPDVEELEALADAADQDTARSGEQRHERPGEAATEGSG